MKLIKMFKLMIMLLVLAACAGGDGFDLTESDANDTVANAQLETVPRPEVAPQAGTNQSDRIFIQREGVGDPVVIIPGLTSSPDVFAPSFQMLDTKDKSYHWVTLGGFGGKPAPSDLTMFTVPAAKALVEQIKERDLQNVSLIGHSMGAVISLLIAAEIPDRIDNILIIDSVPFFAGLTRPNADPIEVAQGKEQILMQLNSMPKEQFSGFMRQGLPIQATSPQSQEIIWRDIERSDQGAIAIATAEIFTTDYRSVLSHIKAKVRVLVPHNEFSPGTPEQIIKRYAELYTGLENVEFISIEKSRHFIMLDQTERFAREVELFLN